VEVTPVSFDELTNDVPTEGSREIRKRVEETRRLQQERYGERAGIHCNAQMNQNELKKYCAIDAVGTNILKVAMDLMGLSARAYDRILKVARTIADIEQSTDILPTHLAEANQFRSLDREGWAG
jgi:magnesium chelatase family protein